MNRIFFALALLLPALPALSQKNHYPEVTIDQLANHPSDTLEIKAMVKARYECPPCPKGAQCKPCIGDHISVSDSNAEATAVQVFCNQPAQFKVGKRYRLRVRFRNAVHALDNIELVAVLK